MGQFEVNVGVHDERSGEVRYVDALVDTGASHSVFPARFLQDLGIRRIGDPKPFEIADDSIIKLYIGEARLIVEGEVRTAPVVFGSENQYILGATSLQNFGLIPDTTREQLIPSPRFLI